ncbi:MAG: ABC transporter permease [Acidimicrobiia bacterium]|nr:ABC transporter permease [Acidimicrobiia bacterium]
MLSPAQRVILLSLGGVLLLSITRALADADQLTSAGTSSAALRLAIPIGMAALGGVFCERSGIINIGLEGMMILGTWFGAWGAWQFGPWEGIAIGIIGGAVGGLIHALATVSFGVDQIVSGVAINILGLGIARYLSVITYTEGTGGGANQSPQIVDKISTIDVPLLAGGTVLGWTSPDLLGWLDHQDLFFISDLAGLLQGFVADVSLVTLLAVALFPLATWILWRTRFGLRLRSAGENPAAAESLGVAVYKMKYLAVVISGGLAGLGGAYLSLVASNIYREGQTNGRGFIGLAAMIFGNWRPFGAAAGSGLFGFADALQLRNADAVHALLLFVALIAGVFAIRAVLRRHWVSAAITSAAGAGFLTWYLTSEEVPSQFTSFTPHVVTLLVLGFATQRLRPPARVGTPYRKGEAH